MVTNVTAADNADADVLVARALTASSSSESLFTDPLTPLGFAAELNQCYYSDENLSAAGFTIVPQSPETLWAGKLAQLSRTHVDIFDTTTAMLADVKASPMLAQSVHVGSDGGAGALFSVSRVKKVELPDLQVAKVLVTDPSGKTTNHLIKITAIFNCYQQHKHTDNNSACNKAAAMEIATPSHVYLTTGLSAVTPGGDSNVLKKVASFTVGERLTADPAASAVSASVSVPLVTNGSGNANAACCSTTMLAARVQRPTYVPEKLNFSAYQRFEGESFDLSYRYSQCLYEVKDGKMFCFPAIRFFVFFSK